jgi:hypothetical protein
MKASAKRLKDGNYLPVIVLKDRKKYVLYGDPLVTRQTAIKYAQLVINTHTEREEA